MRPVGSINEREHRAELLTGVEHGGGDGREPRDRDARGEYDGIRLSYAALPHTSRASFELANALLLRGLGHARVLHLRREAFPDCGLRAESEEHRAGRRARKR